MTRFLNEINYDRYLGLTAPGAGNNLAFDVEDGLHKRILAISFILTTSATAADRRVQLLFTAQDVNYFCSQAQVVQSASLVVQYFVAPGNSESVAILDLRVLMRLPYPLELWGDASVNEGWEWSSDVDGLQAGDAITSIQVYHRGTYVR